jgi:hypothetical protein
MNISLKDGGGTTEKASIDGIRILVRQCSSQVNIEVIPVLRGTVHPADSTSASNNILDSHRPRTQLWEGTGAQLP